LLHDVGHGPFSHALEHSIVLGTSHEEISLRIMSLLNEEFTGQLDLAISVYKGTHHKKFLHQLVSGQLDVDRLDYLKRDSFFTGVSEGAIGSERLIKMMRIHEGELAIEAKALYSLEKFLLARRLMYWQVYLHKTSLSAEFLLTRVLERVRFCYQNGYKPQASDPLEYFLSRNDLNSNLTMDQLDNFLLLDDSDIIQGLKSWQNRGDKVLAKISDMLVNRNLLKIKIQDEPFELQAVESKYLRLKNYGLSEEDYRYFVFTGEISNQTYVPQDKQIWILTKNGSLKELQEADAFFNSEELSRIQQKYYLCFPRNRHLT